MRPIPTLISLLALALPAFGQDVAAKTDPEVEVAEAVEETIGPVEITDQTLADFLWLNRVIAVFADTPRDPAFIRQLELLADRPDALIDRDVVILTDTDPAARSTIRIALRPRGFAMVIVDKDGKVMLRKPSPWDVREISRAIDKTQLRQQELRDARDLEAERRGFPR